MTQPLASENQAQPRDFRVCTASTKVTEAELAELEKAASTRGIRLGEWIREVLLREVRGSSQTEYAIRFMTEIVGLQLFLTHALSPIVQGEKMNAEQYNELMRQVKFHKQDVASEMLARPLAEKAK